MEIFIINWEFHKQEQRLIIMIIFYYVGWVRVGVEGGSQEDLLWMNKKINIISTEFMELLTLFTLEWVACGSMERVVLMWLLM